MLHTVRNIMFITLVRALRVTGGGLANIQKLQNSDKSCRERSNLSEFCNFCMFAKPPHVTRKARTSVINMIFRTVWSILSYQKCPKNFYSLPTPSSKLLLQTASVARKCVFFSSTRSIFDQNCRVATRKLVTQAFYISYKLTRHPLRTK